MKAFYSNAQKRKASTFVPWQQRRGARTMHRMQRRFWLLVVGLGLGLLPLRAETLEEAVRAMTNAEKKFYETGQEKGTRAAFLEFLAPDGIVFRPGPVNGQEAWSKRPETGLDLVWEPTFAAIARSGDFGYTTGPAKWRASKKGEKFLGYGQFISIWKRQKDGSWKVALDCGIENPEPASQPETLRMFVPERGEQVKIDVNVRRKALEETQFQFTHLVKADSADAILAFGAEEVRAYRNGSFPAVGKQAAFTSLQAKAGRLSFDQVGGDMSQSADLAYSYGRYALTRKGDVESGHYLQIWQTDDTGAWKLVLDWQQPSPQS
jgi:ketosteroid isomerase-like protein